MAQDDAIPPSLQESLLALLAFDDKFGSSVAVQVSVDHFDAPYQEIARRLLEYRKQYGRAPSKAHLDDLFGWALEKGEQAPRLRRLVTGLYSLAEGMNAEYTASRVQEHVRKQTLKSAIKRAGERYQAGGEDLIPDIENIMYNALRARSVALDAGTFLDDTNRSLAFLDLRESQNMIPIGIKELDDDHIGAAPKELLLFVAAKNAGKTWFAIHMGRQGFRHGVNVCHIALEYREEYNIERYYQGIFGSASWNLSKFDHTTFTKDEFGNLLGWETESHKPYMSFMADGSREKLRTEIKGWGRRLGRIVVKGFPSGTLTMSQLRAYLDYLEDTHKFVPGMLIVDYPALMRLDQNNFRLDLGRTVVELRGLGVERNMAIVAVAQGTRQTIGAKQVRSSKIAEDITQVNTADNVLTFSQTDIEAELHRGRVRVEHARNARKGQDIIISQAYGIGQWCLSSAPMPRSSLYWDKLQGERPDADIDED